MDAILRLNIDHLFLPDLRFVIHFKESITILLMGTRQEMLTKVIINWSSLAVGGWGGQKSVEVKEGLHFSRQEEELHEMQWVELHEEHVLDSELDKVNLGGGGGGGG